MSEESCRHCLIAFSWSAGNVNANHMVCMSVHIRWVSDTILGFSHASRPFSLLILDISLTA